MSFTTPPKISATSEFPVAGAPLSAVHSDLLPRQICVCGFNPPDQEVGVAGLIANGTWWFSIVRWCTGLTGLMAYDFILSAGTWRYEWFSDKRNDYGIQVATIDGVDIGDQVDHYAATRVRFVSRVEDIVIPTTGRYRVGRRTTGKNAASSNDLLTMSALIMTRVT